MKFLTIHDIARELHWSPGTARNRLSRNDPMPPSFKVGRRRLFPVDRFEAWVKAFFPQDGGEAPPTPEKEKQPRRGRRRSQDPWPLR